MRSYYTTHKFFKIKKVAKSNSIMGSEEADMCKQYLGENDPMMLLQHRKWFTGWDGIYIRLDCLDNELVTWFALKDNA